MSAIKTPEECDHSISDNTLNDGQGFLKEGEIDKSLREEWMIPKRLSNSRRVDPPNAARVFANLVTSGQINSALRYLSENDGGGASCL